MKRVAVGIAVVFTASCSISDVDTDSTQSELAALTTTTLNVTGDTDVRSNTGNQNDGTQTTLKVQSSGAGKMLVVADTNAIRSALVNKTLVSATLQVTLSTATSGFPTGGQPIDVMRMTHAWTELGATYNCANDTNTGNIKLDCATGDQWSLSAPPLPWASTPSASA